MRACGRCGHDNADHLPYCCSCGRRIEKAAGVLPLGPRQETSLSTSTAIGAGTVAGTASAGFAATVALSKVRGENAPLTGKPKDSGAFLQAFDALRYVFVYVRGRIDAEDRRRAHVDERDGAKRLLDAALIELGRIVLHARPETPELAKTIDAVAGSEARRQAAIADLAAAEKFQAADDLRLGAEQASAETEWKSCDSKAGEIDDRLRQFDDERRALDAELLRLREDPQETDADRHDNARRSTLTAKRTRLDDDYGTLRERAAALRASTIAARAKLDQSIATRRQATAAIAASLLAHVRDRTEAEKQLRDLTLEIGRAATELRVPVPAALPSYARVDRLQETIAESDRQLAGVERTIGRYNIRKLAAGLGLLTAIAAAVGTALWAILR